ncbi:MAG: LPS export ABC transporter periplasmic protein LptC [Acidobacteriota bacterium]|nr:LPS export ABC transporter periplasmic protein LptC [Acidobacteriota bacterium]
MQRTIRVLRVALPLVFIGFVLLIAVSWHRGKPHKDKSGAVPVTSTMRPVDKPAVESMTFEDTQTVNGRLASHIRAQRVVAFQSGWNTLENVQMTIYRPTGLTYELVCPQAQFNSNSKEADAKGGVRVTSSDGVEITTAEIHFDGNHLTNHIPVNFKVDRWAGSGGALDLDVPGEMLRLYEKVDATMAPATPAESPLNIRGQEGTFRRKENYADFTKDVVATRDADRINVDHVLSRFGVDHKSLLALEGQGHLTIVMTGETPMAGKTADASGRKTITADRFWSEIGANGQISALNFIGETAPAHAVIEGPPNRDLVARMFRVGLANKQVTDMKADDNVIMKEIAPVKREMTSGHLTVYFDAATHRAASAALEGSVHYKDPKNDAHSVRANYDIVNDQVTLTGEPGFYPAVVADGQTLKAKVIELSPRAGTARATGEVIAQLVSKQQNGAPATVSADATSVFPAGKPVFVNSDTVMMRQANKIAVFSGNVRAWQETNTVFAQELQVQGAGEQVTARGNVRTLLYNTSSNPAAEARKVPMQSTSDVLVSRKTDRRIDLTGNVQIDDGEQRHFSSEHASFFFDANKKMDHIEAQEKVVLVEKATSRRGTGDRATYNVGRRMVYLTGAPATVTAPNGTLNGEMISIDLVHNKVEVVSPKTPMQGTYKPQP